MSTGSGPSRPSVQPQLSPDKKWIWDGTRWLPLNQQHEAAFAAWKEVGASLPSPPAQQAAPPQARRVATPPPIARPAAPVYVAPPAPEMDVPLWKRDQGSTGINKYLYLVAGFIVLVIVGVVLSSGLISLPWQQYAPSRPVAKPTPPLTERSDAARADRFVNGLLAPAMSELNDSMVLTRQTCAVGMTSSCFDAYIQVGTKVSAVLPVIDQESIPVCITPPTTKLRANLAKMDTAVKLAQKGLQDNKADEFNSGASQLSSAYGQVQADSSALSGAAKTCDGQLTGP